MAKHQDEPLVTEQSGPISVAPAQVGGEITYRDKVYTSRTLILPDERQLLVAKATVTVSASDAVALKYLKENAEFEQLKE
ncbi:hypothetical protein C4K22_2120 [Pseudomonas chlororaphis subsp. aurantiaca]|uniref:hypothetical protein n=1 Tax=Pseudomonas chlororaphis TaxID=587753 RepID=UPI000F717306|nr:hypothetical protein [Pseudomonas chlororaphis]AZD34873.1 hypothetical protein C4K22_2120 [Pseudomonas chlororaphis subsp. aurantiaca]AZD41208.1 hypothetical protein C4K21_2124 [Pseudomonas chlororaphis subsp. aurantiaca]